MEHISSSLQVSFAQRSEAGRKPENQDTVGARIPTGSTLSTKGIALAMADGVSSSLAAKQASQTAVTGFLNDYYATPDTWRTQHSAVQVIQSLNRYLWGRSQNSLQQEGLLTTFSALVLKGDTAHLLHVGDTRIYRLRQSQWELLTRDHVQRIDKDTRYLARALGADPSLDIDAHTESLEIGDLYLLTSDGVHDVIPPKTLQAMVADHVGTLDELSDALIDKALTLNSNDNLSVQIARIESVGKPSQSDAVTVLSKLPFPPPMEPGQTLDGLLIEKILHESERSQVYLVKAGNDQAMVMKTPSVNYDDDPAYIERFVLESWIGARIQNAHVVRIKDPPQSRTHLYYLTEYIAGPTLGELIRQRAPFDISDAVELMEQLVKGVRAFHRKDTLHQDIKPNNIIIGKTGAVLIDFGSCWVAGVEEAGSPFARDTILGTLDYSAPEYRYGGTRSQRSDQFSLGVIVYEMLTGKHPYGKNFADTMTAKGFQKLQYIPASHYNPLIPVWLDKAIEKSVAIQANSRYSALSEWLRDLKRPNPMWLGPRDVPFIEKNPVRFWQIVAALGWIGMFILSYFCLR